MLSSAQITTATHHYQIDFCFRDIRELDLFNSDDLTSVEVQTGIDGAKRALSYAVPKLKRWFPWHSSIVLDSQVVKVLDGLEQTARRELDQRETPRVFRPILTRETRFLERLGPTCTVQTPSPLVEMNSALAALPPLPAEKQSTPSTLPKYVQSLLPDHQEDTTAAHIAGAAESFSRPLSATDGDPSFSGPASEQNSLEPPRKRPSEYLAERLLSTDERIKRASWITKVPKIVELVGDVDGHVKGSEVPIDKPLFQPRPSVVMLQSYTPFRTYEIEIFFRNDDKVARRLQIEPINSPYFSIRGAKNDSLNSGKVAPGMEVLYFLRFIPEETTDYQYNLVCVSEREKFLLPIRATGARAILDFPDIVTFSNAPVRFPTPRTLYVRNVGNRPAKFVARVDPPFDVCCSPEAPRCGYLDVNESIQIEVIFNPERVGSFSREMCITYDDTGEEVFILLQGIAEDASIRLEKSTLRLDSTYITLSSIKSLKIFNRSSILAAFKWKELGTDGEESKFRQRKKMQLIQEEEKERLLFRHPLTNEPENTDLSLLSQKYKNRIREVEHDKLLFNDEVFRVDPKEGTIWPGSFVEVNFLFQPQTAGLHSRVVYCEVQGKELRLPLQLKGEGIGPKARFSYDILDIEDIFINRTHKYEVFIENRGEIDVHYTLKDSNTLFGPKFHFDPPEGVLRTGEEQAIRIVLHSDILGEFSEEFKFALQGSPDPLTLVFKGRVVGPTFHFDIPELDFGKLSYGFKTRSTVSLINTSNICMTYALRLPTDGEIANEEFEIEPAAGEIPALGRQVISVDFTPKRVKSYSMHLSVDVESVGEDLYQLPILAESIVPEIVLKQSSLDYGDCFLNNTYELWVELENCTEFDAKYELQSQEESAKSVYAYFSRNASGFIAGMSCHRIQLSIQIKRLGQVTFPIFIYVNGNEDMPLGVELTANGIGPNVIISPAELNWGKVAVLKNASMSLNIHNKSPIPAIFTCSTTADLSVFRVEPDAGTIAPWESADLVITGYLDDSLKFTDIVRIAVQSAGVYEVQLVARGQGTTITFEESLTNVDFKDVFSNRDCSREFTLINKGRRQQTLHWTAEEKRFGAKDSSFAWSPVFEVIPNRFTLKPNASQVIVVKGYSTKAIKCKETLTCQGTMDKDPTRRLILETTVIANFMSPMVEMSPTQLRFHSAHTSDEDLGLLSQNLVLRNTSTLPLHLSLKCPAPYSVEPAQIENALEPNASTIVTVRYDPAFNTDRISCKEQAKLILSYAEHPQRDFVELSSEVSYPNLLISNSAISFGCIPNNTEQKRTFNMTNCSALPVTYSWSFVDGAVSHDNATSVPIHQVFDIIPLHGLLKPGDSEQVEVTFFGHGGSKFSTLALCDVKGGPKYPVSMQGEASEIDYEFDRQVIDFGTQHYQDILEQEIMLSNAGQVAFDFSTIIFPDSSLAQKLLVSPAIGSIPPHGKQKIVVRFCACVPDMVDDNFFIQIAHFEPVKIRIMGLGIFPRIALNLPRVPDERFEGLLVEAKAMIGKHIKGHAVDGIMDKARPTADPADQDIEAEAERMLLKEKMTDFLAKMGEDVRQRSAPVLKGKFIGSSIILYKHQQKTAKEKKHHSISESSHVKLNKYICDFGNVIRNTHKKKTIRITNRGLYSMSFSLDKTLLTGTGFGIDPEKVKSLPGAPHFESVDFQVTFQARSLSGAGELGVAEVELPISVTGGPTSILVLRADVTVPDLNLSSSEIDFSEVLCGQRKTVTIQMHNMNNVACEWTSLGSEVVQNGSKKPKKKPGVAVLKEFELIPAFGLLQPGEKTLAQVRFAPVEEKEYNETMPIKITMNAKPIPLRLFGKGIKPVISFDPETLTMGPILPSSDGIESHFYAHNPTNYPVEIYSLEFDQQYLEEEEYLKHLDGYDNGALFLRPAREPGCQLPENLVEAAKQKIQQEKGLKESGAMDPKLASVTEAGVGELIETSALSAMVSHSKAGRSYTGLPSLPAVTVAANAGASTGVPSNPGDAPTPDLQVNVLLHGPPFSGRTTQARRICKTYGHAYIRIDDAIEGSGSFDGSGNGSGAAGPTKEGARVAVPGAAGANPDTDESSAAARTVPDDMEPFRSEHYDTFEEHAPLPEELIVDILRARFQKDDCSRGVVVDGLESKFSNNPTSLLKAVMRALSERGRKTLFFHIGLDVSHIRERESSSQRFSGDRDTDSMQIHECTEDEYDLMGEAEKEAYDRTMWKYKRRMKELQDRKKLERRHWEEEVAMRLGEKKPDEDGKGPKAKKNRRINVGNRSGTDNKAAPSNKSDGRGLRSDGKGGAASPKQQSQKRAADKDRDRGDRDKGDKAERDREVIEDSSSRFTLSDGADAFLYESTYRRFDMYSSTIDNILTLIRDGEKAISTRPLPNSATPEKKAQKGKAAGTVGAGPASAVASSSASIGYAADVGASSMTMSSFDGDQHGDDGAPPWFHDISGTFAEESVFKSIAEHLPAPAKSEESKEASDSIPPPFVEQIVLFPPERPDIQPHSRYFTLMPPAPALDADDDVSAAVDTTTPGAQPLSASPGSSGAAAGGAGNGASGVGGAGGGVGANGRRSRMAAKLQEDSKIVNEQEDDADKEDIKRFRWVVQPRERKELVVKLNSLDVGKFEQTLNFEIMGARGRYALHCIGHCHYSQIVGDPRKIFSKWRKVKEEKSIIHGEFVIATGTYEFGPLVFSKAKEKYMEKYPENHAILNITNAGPHEIKVLFSLKNDIKGDIFFHDCQQGMDLAPGQTLPFSVWAYPRNLSHFEDMLIICVKDNPEPYLFKLSCVGVKPELEIDKKVLTFDRMLLGRSERREIKIKNNTLIPVLWKLTGTEQLSEEFTVGPLEGILESFQEGFISAEFKGTRPGTHKKLIKLEVNDVDKIGGNLAEQGTAIVVTAEAFDISTDLHFQKGNEGGLDFGVLKVYEEGKQSCTLKNKGKYEVGYRFIFDNKEFSELFTITPQQALMPASDKSFTVQFIFKTSREMHIKDNTSCKCQIYEPTTGEVTATIPVKLSARAVFSKFSILPVRDLNFGAMAYGTKATRQFTIDNAGEFDFRYSIYKLLAGATDKVSGKLRTNSRASRGGGRASSPPTTKSPNRKEMVKQTDALNFGTFTVFPTSGIITAGNKQLITVEFHSDTPGSFEEIAALDISDRSPSDYSDVLEYRLIGESCVSGINTTDFASIFEEQTVCKRLELFNTQGNVYAEEDRVFYFGAYLANQAVQVRFKISNPFKIPCDVTMSTKPRSKTKSDAADFAFDCDPKKISIPSHEYRYVTVTFTPTSIQSYAGIFEAVVDSVAEIKAKALSFELRGEGTLPRVLIEKPSLKLKSGVSLLKFRRLLVGTSQTLPIALKNEGIIPAKVKLEWLYRETEDIECSQTNVYLSLKPQEMRAIEIVCRPSAVRRVEAELKVRVIDNNFEDAIVQITGEGYLDDLTFDNLPNDAENEITFGECFVNESKLVTFNVTNHSNDYLRIAFSEHPDVTFVPTVFHAKPKAQREISVSFLPTQPLELKSVPVPVRSTRIRYFGQPPDVDWDDRMRAVRWLLDNSPRGAGPRKVIEAQPEPAHDSHGSTAIEHSVTLSAFADFSSYECDVSDIAFKSTMMFQTRVYRFLLKNSGKVLLRYAFSICAGDNTLVEQESDACPFSIVPSLGSVEVGDAVSVTVRFSPQDVGDYNFTLICSIANLPSGHRPLLINLRGKSLRPFCHFELADSDYISSERRNVELSVANGIPSSLEQGTRVIEFGSCGVKVRNTKRFYLVNPTSINYNFEWAHQDGSDARVFRCLTPKGLVMSEKKFEIAFEFFPETVEIKESLWRFNIVGHNISIPFLLVGQAMEPNVFMDRASVNFKSLLVGRQLKETVKLINNESIPFSFAFSETSFELGNEGTPVLRFSPTAGTVGANSEMPIEIIFSPSAEKMFNFNLLCNIRKKPTPVAINIKGEGYDIHESLQSELADGTVFELASGATADNTIDFGEVQINEKRLKRIAIVNSGKFNFDFSWKLLSKSGGTIFINRDFGTVAKGERVYCEVAFMPTTTISLKGVKAVCQIANGRSYPLTITGSGCRPLLKLSKTTHDFGTQFTYKPGMGPMTTSVQITNEDVKDISFDVIFPDSNTFDVQRGPSTLAPGETTSLDVTFYPREPRLYVENLKVEINGLSTVNLAVSGEGAEFRVEPVHPDQRNVNFGAVRIGHVVTRTVKIINRSVIPATFQLGPASTLEALAGHSVTLTPQGECTLRPKGTLNLELKFQPQNRIPTFIEELFIEAPGISKPVFVVTGACQGIEVKLENETLPFGAAVQKSSTSRRIQLQNVGDIGAKFRWDVAKFSPDFTISPPEGYISPGMDIPLEITFHPMELNPDIRYENLTCTVEGAQPLFLTLTGMCISQPVHSEAIKFSANVRSSDTKPIQLPINRTSTPWHIRPIIENDYWSGPEAIDIEPQEGPKTYYLTFTPLDMTGSGDGGRHEGSIFFPIPDGTGMLYKLYGTTEKPQALATITRDVPCKTLYTEVLAVTNWLKRPQRFKVIMEVNKPDPSVILKGHDFIDVPGLLTKEYKLSFYAYKEGTTNAKIVFRNEATQEFLWYNIVFKSTPPGVISTIEMTTSVRQLSTKDIMIVNPLPAVVSFTASCSHPDISLPHSFTLQPRKPLLPILSAEGTCTLEYLPLQAREGTARLTLNSPDLGIYQYDLKLVSTPAGPDRSLHFKVGLGGNQTQTFRFISYAKSKTEYTCKIDNPDFTVERTIYAPSAPTGGVEVNLEVTYEPSRLGDVRTQLLVSSSAGGDYGPIVVKPGSTASVGFKNVFSIAATFNFVVDNPAFQVKAAEVIAPKKTVAILITYKQPTGPGERPEREEGTRRERSERGERPAERAERERLERAERAERAERDRAEKVSGTSHGGSKTPSAVSATVSKVGKLSVTHAGSPVAWTFYLTVPSDQ
ncbi:hypothetical protein BDK51DRAFT_29881 [Blyttiomyces helicus]|uniref:MSP domain-containing protein n=1 Tax=Blyttiomyces helicus TaxID=388810 RepID=A0A4P9WNW0_9FUNG|nr:hypothetical protein BDK51DRAFT_29881 [Blyttiomyces helicus]|eukprot:RKO94829.1 hypothetical protein BDK51DRAFT_29881 [Blyttiomyces helicus]